MIATAEARELAELFADALEDDGPREVPARFGDWLASLNDGFRWDYRHFVAMQARLDAVTRGESRFEYFQVPIRHGKTAHNTIRYPAYRIERKPEMHILLCSYNQTKANEFSRDVRKLVASRGVALSKDRDSAMEWETAAGGRVRAVGAGTGVAGYSPDLIVIDDPLGSRADAESKAHRDRVFDWITNDILARATPHTAALKTMSRWHQDDPAGRMLDRHPGKWHVTDLPALAEDNDPLGRAPGEPLWPEVLGLDFLEEQRLTLLDYGFASLMQGRPRPREGGMFKWDWWKLLDAAPQSPRIVRYWDMAGTRPEGRGSDPDYTAGVAMGAFTQGTAVFHVERFRVEVAARKAKMLERARLDKATYGGRIAWWLEAQAGIGGKEATDDIVREVQRLGIPCYTERATGSKAERATPLASAALAGNVYLGPDDPAQPWRDAFRLEAADFPHGTHDDQVDAAAGAFAKLSTPVPTIGVTRRSLA